MGFFKFGSINLYYEVTGRGSPLLLINGLGGDTRLLSPLANNLESSFTVISYDMRSAGKSDKPDAPFTISDLADEAEALIRFFGLKKVSVMGFSMGGMVAMQLALTNPEMIQKMFLVSTTASFSKISPPSDEILKMFRRTDVCDELLTLVYEAVFGPAFKKKVSAEAFIKLRMEDDNPQPATAYLRQLDAVLAFDICDSAKKISVPTVLVAGDSDRIVPPANSLWLSQNIRGSKLFTLKDIGHMVPLEAPDELADIVIKTCLQ